MTEVLRRACERVDLAAGTVRVELGSVIEQRRRLEQLAEGMREAADAFRVLGLAGSAALVAAWLFERLREAGVADAHGITLAEAFAQVTGRPAGPARQPDHV